MKSIFMFFGALIAGYSINAQPGISQNRKLTIPTTLQECTIEGNLVVPAEGIRATAIPLSVKVFKKGTKFTIISQDKDQGAWVVYVWNYKPNTSNYFLFNKDPKDGGRQRFFLIPKTQIELISQEIFKQFSPVAGGVTFPFKYRHQDKLFEPTFSLSATAGVRFDPARTNNFTMALLFGIGPSSADVNETNSTITSSTQLSAVTLSGSLVFEWQKVQLGLSVGFDNLLSGNTNKWKYQGKSWYSVGIGIALFTSNKIQQPGGN